MKALTLTQPWASLVACGRKRIETRGWSTSYRGPLAIHAAKGYPRWAREFAEEERAFARVPEQLPLGAIVATCRLARVFQVGADDAMVPADVLALLSLQETLYGDYSAGRFGWVLADVVALAEPIPARGSLGLWDWEPAEGFAR